MWQLQARSHFGNWENNLIKKWDIIVASPDFGTANLYNRRYRNNKWPLIEKLNATKKL